MKGRGIWKLRASPRRALPRGELCYIRAIELDGALIDAEHARERVDEGALSRTVWTDQSNALALAEGKIERVDRGKAAEALRHLLGSQDRGVQSQGFAHAQRSRRVFTTPTMPLGASATKTTSSTPTSIRLSTEEIVTVVTC